MKAIHEGTVWKVSKYGIYGKYRSEITPYLDTFHAVRDLRNVKGHYYDSFIKSSFIITF